MRVLFFSGFGLLWLFSYAHSASAQSEREYQRGYRSFQNSAPEFLQIDVIEVTAEPAKGIFGNTKTRVKASARVVDVIRSDSGVANGDVITLRYDHAPKAGNSAETPPILQNGKSYPAFLEREGEFFVPVARHLSFSEPSGIQMKVYEEARTRSREKALAAANPPVATIEPLVKETPPIAPVPVVVAAPPEPSPRVQPPESLAVETASLSPAASTVPPRAKTQKVKKSPVAKPVPMSEEVPVVVATVESEPLPSESAAPVVTAGPPTPIVETLGESPSPTPAPLIPAELPPVAEVTVSRVPPPTTPETTPAPVSREENLTEVVVEKAPPDLSEPVLPPEIRPSTNNLSGREEYAEIYGLIKEGENDVLLGKTDKARASYTEAKESLLKLKASQPNFQPFMVEYRLRDIDKKLKALSDSPPKSDTP